MMDKSIMVPGIKGPRIRDDMEHWSGENISLKRMSRTVGKILINKVGSMEFVTQLPVNEPLDWILNVTMIKINKNLNKLQPSFITGFTDAESSFVIKISRDHRAKTGWRIDPAFEIGLNEKDLVLLKKIQSFFAKGSIRKNKVNNAVIFAVQSIKDLATVIIPHFEKYPLISQKRVDFELFKQVVVIMINKQHLSLSGLQEVVNIRASMNKGFT